MTVVDLGPLTLQCTNENLPRVAWHSMRPGKVGILAWAPESLLPVVRGAEMGAGELMSLGRDMESYHRTHGSVDHFGLIIDADELTRRSVELTGRALQIESGQKLRPSEDSLAGLLSLFGDARRVARTAPEIFANAEASRALEHALVQQLITCLLERASDRRQVTQSRRAQVMARFEAVVEANESRSLYLPELCGLVGVPERTLRKCCQEHLGMSPHRYLLRRRMQLARRALLQSDPRVATVTSVATRYGFWELGRFASLYRSLFGEAPSATLRGLG